MGIGTSLFLIAVGAILKFAVHATVSGVSIATVGVILMVVGAVGLLISLFYLLAWRDRTAASAGGVGGAPVRERAYEREPLP
jgi:hypothetical protein